MSKRFTDTDKWDRPWFRKLPATYKLLWGYITDKCDMIGVWYVDFEMASFVIGESISEEEALKHFQKQIRVVDSSRWLIIDFVNFQYGELSENNNLHRSVSAKLRNINSAPDQPLTSPSRGAKVLVMEREKDVSSSFGERSLREGVEIPADLMPNESAIRDWLKYKQERRESYKPTGLKGLWFRIRAIPSEKRNETILTSIGNGWKGIYETKGGANGSVKAGYAEPKPGKYQD